MLGMLSSTDEGVEGGGNNGTQQQNQNQPNVYQNNYNPNPYNYQNYNNYQPQPNQGVNLYANVQPMNVQGPSNNDFMQPGISNNNNNNNNNAPPPYVPPSNNNNNNNSSNNCSCSCEEITKCCGLGVSLIFALIIGINSLINILLLCTYTIEIDDNYNDTYDWCKKTYNNWTVDNYYDCDTDTMTTLCKADDRCWAPGDSYYGEYCDTDYGGSCKCCADRKLYGWWIFWLTWISWIGCCEIVRMFMILTSSNDDKVIDELRDTHWLFCICLCNPDKGWTKYKDTFKRNGYKNSQLPFCFWWVLFCESLPTFALILVYMQQENIKWSGMDVLTMLTLLFRLLVTWRRICQKNEDPRNHNKSCDCNCNC